jgi:hypothetical protein
MKPSLSCAALQMAGQWCKMAEKSLTQLIFVSTVALGLAALVAYYLLEPRLDSGTANLAVIVCASTPLVLVLPLSIVLSIRLASGMNEKIHDARRAKEQSDRERDARIQALEARAEYQQNRALITASRVPVMDMQKTDDDSWEIPVSWG